jgi:hypothetical protein
MANQSDLNKTYLNKEDYRNKNLSNFPLGIACSNFSEDVPNFADAPCEEIIKGKHNTYIILGRDRPSDRNSGYGGRGTEKAGTIDIVVGRASSATTNKDANGEPLWANNNVWRDASRIYISQRTDVDANFGIVSGSSGIASNSPAIAIKSDHVRIVGRGSVKIVTGTDSLDGLNGKKLQKSPTIDLIGGNNEDLQPVVKGNNLKEALIDITEKLDNVIGILSNFIKIQMEYNTSISNHTHFSPFFGQPTSPSPTLLTDGVKLTINNFKDNTTSLMAAKANILGLQTEYLLETGKKYINSSYVNTT